jgi:hypothetical protein
VTIMPPAPAAVSALPVPAPLTASPVAGVDVPSGHPGTGWPRDQQVRVGPLSIPAASDHPRFSWFPAGAGPAVTPSWNGPTLADRRAPGPEAAPTVEAWDRSVEPVQARRGGLNRRVPGQHAAGLVAGGVLAATPAVRDAQAERAQMEGFAQADILAARSPFEPDRPPQRGGLTRRTPGAHVNAAARAGGAAALTGTAAGGPLGSPLRDPAAERDQMAGFLDGFARGAHRPTTNDPPARRDAR